MSIHRAAPTAVLLTAVLVGACTGAPPDRPASSSSPSSSASASAAPAGATGPDGAVDTPTSTADDETSATPVPRTSDPASTGDEDAPVEPSADDLPGDDGTRAPVAAEVVTGTTRPLRFAPAWTDAADPAELAATIERTEAVARDPATDAATRTTAGFEAQLAYRQLARTPAWQPPVLGRLPPALRRVAEGNLEARAALDLLRSEGWARRGPPTTLPVWEVVPAAPVDELVGHYRDAAEAIGVEWQYLAAINLVETRMGRIRGLSEAGARGPMQFIPESWAAFGAGGDITDERDSIFAAARHLRQRGWDESPRAALYRYNNSEHYVDAVDAYAGVLAADPGAYATYHGWQTFYATEQGTFLLPVGYREERPVPVEEYVAREVVEVRR